MPTPHILFMCVANSARSQMAEGLARHIFGSAAIIESAGSHPSKVNPFAIEVMEEIGIDLSKHYSKPVDALPSGVVAGLDYVVTLCAEEVCPVILSKAKKLHWPLPDPAGKGGTDGEQLNRFRQTRDELKRRIEAFRAELRSANGCSMEL